MDDFERELREMLNDRVASMPATHDVPPELLTRARRRRTTKLTALAVSVVIVAAGTAGAIAQVAASDGPQRVVTSTPTSGPPNTDGESWTEIPPGPVVTFDGNNSAWNGTELIVGENDSNTSHKVAAYNPQKGTWRSLPDTPFPAPRIFAAVGHKVYAGAGTNVETHSVNTPFAVLEPDSGTWRTLATAPDAIWSAHAVFDAAGGIYFFGDLSDVGDAFPQQARGEVFARYDIAHDSWTTLPRSGLATRYREVVSWANNALLVWGGANPTGQAGPQTYGDGAVFDPAAGKWHVMAPSPMPRSADPAAVWTGKELIVWGGESCGGYNPNRCINAGPGAAYDPATDTWRTIADSPLRTTLYPATEAAVWDGQRMIVLGDGQATSGPAAAEYDPAKDAWTTIAAPFPVSVRELRRNANNQKLVGAVWAGDKAIFALEVDDAGGKRVSGGVIFHPDVATTFPTAPPPTSTSTPTTSTTTTPRASVATVACPLSYGVVGRSIPPPPTTPRAPTAGDPALFSHLESFAATDDPRMVALGPSGWSCHGLIATDGNNGIVVYKTAAPGGGPPDIFTAPIAVDSDWLWHGGVGSVAACRATADPAAVQYVTQYFPQELPCPSAGRTVTRIDAHASTFVDADGTRGAAWILLPSSPTVDDGQVGVLTCRPTAGLTAADCDTVIADWLARNDVSG